MIVNIILGSGILIFYKNKEKNCQPGKNIKLEKTWTGGVLYNQNFVIKKEKKYFLILFTMSCTEF